MPIIKMPNAMPNSHGLCPNAMRRKWRSSTALMYKSAWSHCQPIKRHTSNTNCSRSAMPPRRSMMYCVSSVSLGGFVGLDIFKCPQHAFNFINCRVQVTSFDDERRQKTQYIRTGGQCQNAALHQRLQYRRDFDFEFDAEHQPQAAHFANQR